MVYLFHGFVVLGAEFAGFKGWAADHWPLSLVLTTVRRVGAGALPGLAAGLEPAERVRRPDRVGSRFTVEGVEIGPPRRGDRVERHLVEQPGPLTRGGVAAEVGGVPGGHLARSRPVVRQQLEALEQLGQRGARARGSARSGRPPGATYIGAPKARSTRRRRVKSSGGAGSPTEKSRWVPQIATGTTGRRSRGPATTSAAHQRAHRVGVARSRPRGSRTPPRRARAPAARAGRCTPAPAGSTGMCRIRSMNHGTTGTSQTSWRVMNRT